MLERTFRRSPGNMEYQRLPSTTGSGMEMNELKKYKELEEENRKLKQMYADLALDNKILKDILGKKF
jgi:hypothetical protein